MPKRMPGLWESKKYVVFDGKAEENASALPGIHLICKEDSP